MVKTPGVMGSPSERIGPPGLNLKGGHAGQGESEAEG